MYWRLAVRRRAAAARPEREAGSVCRVRGAGGGDAPGPSGASVVPVAPVAAPVPGPAVWGVGAVGVGFGACCAEVDAVAWTLASASACAVRAVGLLAPAALGWPAVPAPVVPVLAVPVLAVPVLAVPVLEAAAVAAVGLEAQLVADRGRWSSLEGAVAIPWQLPPPAATP